MIAQVINVTGAVGIQVEDLAHGIGVLVPTSPLSGVPLNVDLTKRSRVAVTTEVIQRIDDALNQKTALVPVVEIPSRVVDTRGWIARTLRAVKRAAVGAAETVRVAFNWLLPADGVIRTRTAIWRRDLAVRYGHASRHSHDGARECAMQLIQRLRAAREQQTEGDLRRGVYFSASREPVSVERTRFWVARAIEAIREYDNVRSATGAHYEQAGYQFRC